jgi:hypothetical protein
MGTDKEDLQRKINQVDMEGVQYMTHAERKCRQLKSGRICFSLEFVLWIKRKQIYRSLMEYKLGRNKNRGNLKRAAHIQKIEKPLSDISGAAEDSFGGMSEAQQFFSEARQKILETTSAEEGRDS